VAGLNFRLLGLSLRPEFTHCGLSQIKILSGIFKVTTIFELSHIPSNYDLYNVNDQGKSPTKFYLLVRGPSVTIGLEMTKDD
jgi:hypothetical protein